MSNEITYKPTVEEMSDAYDHMTKTQEEMSARRQEFVNKGVASEYGKIKFEEPKKEEENLKKKSIGYRVNIKGHALIISKNRQDRAFSFDAVDGIALSNEQAKRLSDKYGALFDARSQESRDGAKVEEELLEAGKEARQREQREREEERIERSLKDLEV